MMHASLGQLERASQKHALVTSKLARLADRPGFKEDVQFLEGLNLLMAEYGKDKVEAAGIARRLLAREAACLTGEPSRRRELKTYINPFTQECVHTRANYSRLLRSWIEHYGIAVVETWAEP